MDSTSSGPCLVCGDAAHGAPWCSSPEGLLRRLAGFSVAFQAVTDRDELQRLLAASLQELTGARRVHCVVHATPEAHGEAAPGDAVAEALANGEPVPPVQQGAGAVVVLPLRTRDGQCLGDVVLHPAPAGLSSAALALATTVANGAGILLENMLLAAAAQEEARRQERLLGALAGAVREALTPVEHAAAQLQAAAPGMPVVARAGATIATHTARAVRLLDDLLDLRRGEAGQLALHPVTCVLERCVDRAVAALRPDAELRGVRVEVQGAVRDQLLMADADRITQLLQILLHNAIRFSRGGGTVWVQLSPSPVAGDGRVRVAVVDHGVGIPPAHLETVFTPPALVEAHHERRGPGLGIGLALARRIALLHGGTLTAHSEGIGHGSTFVVQLPGLAMAPFLSPAHPAAPATGRGRRTLRVLVVDDNRDAADALELLLARDGHQVAVCYDGAEALRRHRAEGHDVVLLDIGLPGVSGYEVARAIRTAEGDHPALLVALTGWGKPVDRRHSFESGFDHHLVKPVAYPALRGLLRQWVGDPPEAEEMRAG